MSSPDGGPAFPVTEIHGVNQGHPGMTLLDYFAGQAVLAIPSLAATALEHGTRRCSGFGVGPNLPLTPAVVAKVAYDLATEMLTEKQRREGGSET